jgi:hypothetical protein
MEVRVTDMPQDEPLRQTHIRVYMEVTIPSKNGGKRYVVSHDYAKETTIDQLEKGNLEPLHFIGSRQWSKLVKGLEELNR